MGNRACITIKQETGEPFHLYTHWGADSLAETLASALRKAKEAGRLTDSPYCTRIIFDELTGLTGSTTGYGIIAGDYPGDLAYEPLVVEWPQGYGEPIIYGAISRYDIGSGATEFIEQLTGAQR